MEENLKKDCGVSEASFPLKEKCFSRSDAKFIISYQKLCPHCWISTSLPVGASLKTTTIFECGNFGYGKRKSE